MKLAFLPAQLELNRADDGFYIVTIKGQEILRSRSQRVAIAKFKKLRIELGPQFPARELSDEDRLRARQNAILDWMVPHNSLGGRKKKTSARSTRTFGG